MKTYTINAFVYKKGSCTRTNFNIKTDKTSELDLVKLILEKLDIKKEWEKESDNFELITSENVINYSLLLKSSNFVESKESK